MKKGREARDALRGPAITGPRTGGYWIKPLTQAVCVP